MASVAELWRAPAWQLSALTWAASRRELGIKIWGQPLQIKLQANLLKSRKNPPKRGKRDGSGSSDDVYETLCNSGQSGCTGGPGLGAPPWAGQVETRARRGPGRADNMRHSVARHPGPGHGTHRPLWTLRSETIVSRGASALLPVCWGTGNWLQWLKMKVWNIWNTCEWLCKAPRPVCPCFLCDFCDGDLNSAPAPLLRLLLSLCYKAGTCGAFVERGRIVICDARHRGGSDLLQRLTGLTRCDLNIPVTNKPV